jgi:hypothetical protein
VKPGGARKPKSRIVSFRVDEDIDGVCQEDPCEGDLVPHNSAFTMSPMG